MANFGAALAYTQPVFRALGLPLLLASGCSLLVSFDQPDDPPPDAMPVPDAPAPDAESVLGPWGNELPVTELNSPSADLKISLTGDGLIAFFDSDRGGNRDIYTSTRPTVDEPFGQPLGIITLASAGFDGHPAISDDGLTLLFARNAGLMGGVDIFESTRMSLADPFSAPVVVPSLSSAATDDGPDLSADGETLVFSSSRSGSRDLFIASRVGTDWNVTELAALNTPNDELDPDISADLLEVYFARREDGVATVMVATRASPNDPFSAPVAVPELGDVTGPRLSSDRLSIFFHRDNGVGGVDLFTATRM